MCDSVYKYISVTVCVSVCLSVSMYCMNNIRTYVRTSVLCPAASVAMDGQDETRMRQCQYCHEYFAAAVLKNHKVGRDGVGMQRQD